MKISTLKRHQELFGGGHTTQDPTVYIIISYVIMCALMYIDDIDHIWTANLDLGIDLSDLSSCLYLSNIYPWPPFRGI